ncbi:restriction endonuclease subunit S [Tengunoibacter tsumagoiensis]|uniref:Restriction endonuclease subunit S n=1 Tax=Tengunoibacter tsumagoiensis TaxID=2014871 RepID=A0A402A7X2_9CHLR|nr:restriction endonuclease subunit S [Tengunoibacter tsumagoiensis]GCE15105.1 restriction endonuclease subunit S [Tengunoibacter tsumagoiensis]
MVATSKVTMVNLGYKQTDLGMIPEDWEAKTFGEVMTGFTSGATPSRTHPEFFKGDIRWITSRELGYNVINDTIEKISVEAVFKTNLKLLPKGTFLIAITGMEAEGTRGRCGIVGEEATTNQHCMALFPSKELNTSYLFHYYMYKGKALAVQYCQGTKQQDYTGKIVKLLPIVFPPSIKEQQAIATALSDIDALITSLDKLISKKRAIKQATMQQLLTGKMRLPGFSGNENGKLGDLFDLNPKRTLISDTDSVTLIRMEDISENGTILNQNVVPLSLIKKGLTFFERNDVLVAKITPCFENGKGACLDTLKTRFGFGSTEFHILRAKRNAISRYIFYQTQTVEFRQQLELEMIGTAGQKRVPLQSIRNYVLPVLHSREEQQAIAAVLSDMDTEIEALEQRRDKTVMVKQGMMQELLTGKTRLV